MVYVAGEICHVLVTKEVTLSNASLRHAGNNSPHGVGDPLPLARVGYFCTTRHPKGAGVNIIIVSHSMQFVLQWNNKIVHQTLPYCKALVKRRVVVHDS